MKRKMLEPAGPSSRGAQDQYLRAWISYEGLQRIESWPVPMPALREAVLNAVVHKSDRPKSSRQRYRLTAKAEALRAKLPSEKGLVRDGS